MANIPPRPPPKPANLFQDEKTENEDNKENVSTGIWETWCDRTTLHGITDWYHDKHYLSQFIWTLILLAFASLAFFQISLLMVQFRNAPHWVSTIYMDQELVQPLPNVTICNFNRVKKSKMIEFGLSSSFVEFMNGAMLSMNAPISFQAMALNAINQNVSFQNLRDSAQSELMMSFVMKNIKTWEQFYATRTDLPLRNMAELYTLLGYQCKDIFKKCSVAGQAVDCCQSAEIRYNTELGICWHLVLPKTNTENYRTQDIPGQSFGMRLELSPGLDEYNNEVVINEALKEGLILSTDPDSRRMLLQNSVALAPGTWNKILIERRVTRVQKRKLSVYKPECTDNGQLVYSSANYDQLNCMFDCLQFVAYTEAGCVFFAEVKGEYQNMFCNASMLGVYKGNEILNGVHQAMQDFAADSKNPYRQCKQSCKPTCAERVQFNQIVNTIQYPAARYLSALSKYSTIMGDKQLSEAQLKEGIVVDLFYGGTEHLRIEMNEKIPIEQLIGNTGGQLGLWLGASLVTVVQALYYLTKSLVHVCWKYL